MFSKSVQAWFIRRLKVSDNFLEVGWGLGRRGEGISSRLRHSEEEEVPTDHHEEVDTHDRHTLRRDTMQDGTPPGDCMERLPVPAVMNTDEDLDGSPRHYFSQELQFVADSMANHRARV